MEARVNLKNLRNITNTVYYPYMYNRDRYLVLYGGAGSGKSWFVCEKLLVRAMREPGHKILVCRKVARTLRRSVFQLFRTYISNWGIGSLFKVNHSNMEIRCINGSVIYFTGIDDPEKLKSIEGITSIWVEEASEIYLKDFEELDRRLRGNFPYYKQIILTYNPIVDTNWTFDRFFVKPKEDEAYKAGLSILKTTYRDNRFIDEGYKAILERYTGNARLVYTEGEYGKLENAVYTNWNMVDSFPLTTKAIYGLDFGFVMPQALVRVYLKDGTDLYVEEKGYATRQDTPELIKELKRLKIQRKLIIADNEDPSAINQIGNAGFDIIPCKKGQGSVEEGIKLIQGLKIHIVKGSTNIVKEILSYQRMKDKNTDKPLEQVDKSNDHLLDAIRYVVFTYYFGQSETQVR